MIAVLIARGGHSAWVDGGPDINTVVNGRWIIHRRWMLAQRYSSSDKLYSSPSSHHVLFGLSVVPTIDSRGHGWGSPKLVRDVMWDSHHPGDPPDSHQEMNKSEPTIYRVDRSGSLLGRGVTTADGRRDH